MTVSISPRAGTTRDVALGQAYPRTEYRAKARILGGCPTHHEFLDLDYIMDYTVERFARNVKRDFRQKLDNFDEKIDDENDEMSGRYTLIYLDTTSDTDY